MLCNISAYFVCQLVNIVMPHFQEDISRSYPLDLDIHDFVKKRFFRNLYAVELFDAL